MLQQIDSKNKPFSKQLAELLDLNDGINVKEAKALKTVYDWIKDVEFPYDFASKNAGEPQSIIRYKIDVSWQSQEPRKWDIGIHVKAEYMKSMNVWEHGLEKDDKMRTNTKGSTRLGSAVISSNTQEGDVDGVNLYLTTNPNPLMCLGVNGAPIDIRPDNLPMEYKGVTVSAPKFWVQISSPAYLTLLGS